MTLNKKNALLLSLYALLTVMLVFVLWSIRESERSIPVINYHQINPVDKDALTVPPHVFAAEMKYLHDNGYHTISPDELYAYLTSNTPLPPKPILITFDDGYEDNYTYAYPILKEYNMKATIFLVSDYMDRFDKYLTWQQVYEMSANNIYMGSHTLSHYELTPLSTQDMDIQLVGGKLAVEWHTFRFCEFIAYPCGSFNTQVLSETKKAGYKGGFTVYYDYVRAGDDPYKLSRIPIYGNLRLPMLRFWIRLKAAPVVGRLERLRASLLESNHDILAEFIPTP